MRGGVGATTFGVTERGGVGATTFGVTDLLAGTSRLATSVRAGDAVFFGAIFFGAAFFGAAFFEAAFCGAALPARLAAVARGATLGAGRGLARRVTTLRAARRDLEAAALARGLGDLAAFFDFFEVFFDFALPVARFGSAGARPLARLVFALAMTLLAQRPLELKGGDGILVRLV